MRIFLAGLSHHTAPLETREALALSQEELPAALEVLGGRMEHGVIVSTCNRTEVYTVARDAQHAGDSLDRFFSAQFGVDPGNLRNFLYSLEQDDAVSHLFRVASGLDSQILGESEILGQVRDAFSAATRQGVAGGVLARLFHGAIRTGKRARAETAIGRNALSISRACVQLAKRAAGPLDQQRALVLGVGEASRLAGVALRDAGATDITVANRTPANAVPLALELGAELQGLDDLTSLLANADVVVTATAAPDYILSRALIQNALERRSGGPLVILDIAVPRDVDPAAAFLPGVLIYTLDDLAAVAEANRREREAEARRVEEIVAEEVERFRAWWDARTVVPTIAAIRRQAEQTRSGEVARAIEQMDLAPEEIRRIESMTRSLVKKLLHHPTLELRARNDESLTLSARRLFGIDE